MTIRYLKAGAGFGIGTLGGVIASVVIYAVILAFSAMFGCQPPNSETPGEAKGAFGIDKLEVEGKCDAKLNIAVRTPFPLLPQIPINVTVNTAIVNGHTIGAVILDLMGSLSHNMCSIDTRTKPSWACKAFVMGQPVNPPPLPVTPENPLPPATIEPKVSP